jgi:hypothetical protein
MPSLRRARSTTVFRRSSTPTRIGAGSRGAAGTGRPLMRFSDFRRCIGTILAEAGVEARLIHELLGHAGSGRWRSTRGHPGWRSGRRP